MKTSTVSDPKLREARLPLAFTALAGIWLIAAPFALRYGEPDAGAAGYWNDIVTGAVLVAICAARLKSPGRFRLLGVLSVVLGLWLVFSPFALSYDLEPNHSAAKANDVIVGILVAVTATVSTTVAVRRAKARDAAGASRASRETGINRRTPG